MPEVIWAYTPDPIEEASLAPGSTELGSSALIATPAKTAKKGIPPPIKKALLR
jgi:hypothetical protein